ncbi:MAG: hypothetical protein ACI92G_001994 [Candidatus Pelagisphaera sp.]|jgi:hypothetical protein
MGILLSSMTFLKSTASNNAPSPISLNRSKIRSLFRKGGAGNASAFVQATSYYLDLLSEYFYLLGYTEAGDRLFEIEATLFECWRYAPYIRRVSDFERFLEIQLEKRSKDRFLDLPEPHAHLNDLNHQQRFLLVARVYQGWTYRSLHLATRIKKPDLGQALSDLKCLVTGFKPQLLKTQEQALVIQLSQLMEGELKTRDARALEKDLAKHFHVLQFKAQWLGYRCELAELKIQMTIDPKQLGEFKDGLNDKLKDLPTERPKFKESVLNQISFMRAHSNLGTVK